MGNCVGLDVSGSVVRLVCICPASESRLKRAHQRYDGTSSGGWSPQTLIGAKSVLVSEADHDPVHELFATPSCDPLHCCEAKSTFGLKRPNTRLDTETDYVSYSSVSSTSVEKAFHRSQTSSHYRSLSSEATFCSNCSELLIWLEKIHLLSGCDHLVDVFELPEHEWSPKADAQNYKNAPLRKGSMVYCCAIHKEILPIVLDCSLDILKGKNLEVTGNGAFTLAETLSHAKASFRIHFHREMRCIMDCVNIFLQCESEHDIYFAEQSPRDNQTTKLEAELMAFCTTCQNGLGRGKHRLKTLPLIFRYDWTGRAINEVKNDPHHFHIRGLASSKEEFYPYLLINVKAGVSFHQVTGPGESRRVGGSPIGGATFLGLLRLILPEAQIESIDDAVALCNKGDNSKCDMLVSDIYGGDYAAMSLPGYLIASSMGKLQHESLNRNKDVKSADIAVSLLTMTCFNIAHLAHFHCKIFNLQRIALVGILPVQPSFLAAFQHSINFWSKGTCQVHFFRSAAYVGALGAILRHRP